MTLANVVSLIPIPNIPHVQTGDDVGALLLEAMKNAGIQPQPHDILAIAQKIISKAEGRHRALASVTPSEEADLVAKLTEKDPRLVELILQESDGISRMKQGVLIVRHKLGFTSANAGIDRSNVEQAGDDETVLLLPVDPDASAQAIRQIIHDQLGHDIGVVITDSHGRPFRKGTLGVAIGVAGIPALWDRRGEPDLYGFQLQHTDVGIGDEIAAAAGLVMGQANEGMPAVLIRGLTVSGNAGSAADLYRSKATDLYR